MTFHFVHSCQETALLFPGQGSQEVGMMQSLTEAHPVARATFEEADDTLGFSLSRYCFEGPEEDLTDTINAQPALLAASVAVMRVIETQFQPTNALAGSEATESRCCFVAGHSMGEYTALVAAGCLGFTDGLHLVRRRGELMKEAGERTPGMMAAVLGMDEDKVAEICAEVSQQGGIAQVANDNCPGQTVISGDAQGMEAAMAALSDAGARKVVKLAVSIAAHSPLMQPAAQELQAAIEATPIKAPQVPVIANMTGETMTTVEDIRTELIDQLTGSVRWTTSMQHAVNAGVTNFVEIGPGDVLTKLMKRIQRKSTRRAVNDPASVEAFVESISNA